MEHRFDETNKWLKDYEPSCVDKRRDLLRQLDSIRKTYDFYQTIAVEETDNDCLSIEFMLDFKHRVTQTEELLKGWYAQLFRCD